MSIRERQARIAEIRRAIPDADEINYRLQRDPDFRCRVCRRHGGHFGNCVLAELENHENAVRGYYTTDV